MVASKGKDSLGRESLLADCLYGYSLTGLISHLFDKNLKRFGKRGASMELMNAATTDVVEHFKRNYSSSSTSPPSSPSSSGMKGTKRKSTKVTPPFSTSTMN